MKLLNKGLSEGEKRAEMIYKDSIKKTGKLKVLEFYN